MDAAVRRASRRGVLARAVGTSVTIAIAIVTLVACALGGPPRSGHGDGAAQASSLGSASAVRAARREVVALVNDARSEGRRCGSAGWFDPAPAVTPNETLMAVAQAHSVDQDRRRTMTHLGAKGSIPADRVEAAGYAWSRVGENVGYVSPSPETVMAAWLESDGHCATLMRPGYTEIGVGLRGRFWTQLFAAPR